ncbi:MAG: aminotransferase class V-fold PLP-dependent enzyme [Polyangiaceae bacterium]|nr:aminotransferase class V-fold PLP-dependent enzyme [Polyangiaceae bacterium]
MSALPPRPVVDSPLPAPSLGSRSLFPTLEAKSFLAHAAISPASAEVSRAVTFALEDVAARGPGSYLRWAGQRERLREELARFLCTAVGNVALTRGTTAGIIDVALASPIRSGDTVVSFHGEFPANIQPWRNAAQLRGASFELLSSPRGEQPRERCLEETEAALKRGARFLTVSAVQFQTGYQMPLADLGELCRRYDAFFFVDAIQAAGVIPIRPDEWAADAIFVGAHKWMLGLEGVGYAMVSERFRDAWQPLTTGWTSAEGSELFLFEGPGHLDYELPLKRSADCLEGSTPSVLGYAALEAGLAMIQALGEDRIFSHVQALHDKWEPLFQEAGFESLRGSTSQERSGLLSFLPPAGRSISEWAAGFREQGVIVSTPDGCLRLAPHYSNHEQETAILAEALRVLCL